MTEKRKESLSFKTIIAIFIGSALISGAILFPIMYYLLKPAPPEPYYLQGNPTGVRELSQPRDVIDFTFPSTTGEDLSLSDFVGEHVVMFFGYTHCPDVCMLTMSEVRQVHQLLGEDADNVTFLFISVDPARDTPERLAEFFLPFGVQDYTIGLQGDDITLQQISADYSLFYDRHEDEGENYSVDHSASQYYINPDGQLDTIFAYGTRADLIADHLLQKMR